MGGGGGCCIEERRERDRVKVRVRLIPRRKGKMSPRLLMVYKLHIYIYIYRAKLGQDYTGSPTPIANTAP
jgi:hypothetical protein